MDPSHPPLLRAWAALPLLVTSGVSSPVSTADNTAPSAWIERAYAFSHRFLYLQNDADRLLYRARFMVLLLGVLLGVLVYCWAREWLGPWGAGAALACYALEPNLLAHSTLVTTDLGVTCLMFGAIYFLWRTSRAFTWPNVAGLVAFFTLAVASKFSALFLGPMAVLLLTLALYQRSTITARLVVLLLGVLALSSIVGLWASYGFRYLPSDSPSWAFHLDTTAMAAKAPGLAGVTRWIDGRHLLPNAFTEGLFYASVSLERMPAFFAGTISTDGWWLFFPVAFLIKTPVALLLLIAAGVAACVRRRRELGSTAVFIALPAVLFLAVAMASGVNLGVRHILPVYPLLVLIAGAGATELLRMPRRVGPTALALVSLVLAGETVRVYPNPLTFFNQLVGGPDNGHHYLLDSNLGWGQSLKGLKAWMGRTGVDHVNLAYFGQADPAYYGINCTHLPGAPSFATESIGPPRLPGYVALSETLIHGVYAPPQWRLFYAPFQDAEPLAIIDHEIRVYWVTEWPEAVGPAAGDAAPEAHLALADAMLYGFHWPARAVVHYREYFKAGGGSSETLVNYGIALVAAKQTSDGVTALRQAVALDGDNGRARLTLARALFGSADLDGAAAEAESAVRLMARNADAHLLRGRVAAARGHFDRAAREFQTVVDLVPGHAEAAEYLRRLTGVSDASRRQGAR